MTERVRRAIAASFLLCLATLGAPRRALADEAETRSRQLFAQGSELANNGQFAEACPLLQQAHDLHATNGTALRLADCYEKTGKYEQALALYQYVLERRHTDKNAERVALAESRVAALKKQLAADPLPSATATATPTATATGTTATATATATATSTVTATSAPAAKRSRGPMIAALSVGGAGVVLGTLSGGLALSLADKVKRACGDRNFCPDQRETAQQADGLAWLSNIGFTMALAGAVTAVILIATRPSQKTQQAVNAFVGPDGVTFRF